MGVSENSVPLNPMVNDHYPYQMAIIGNIPYFQTNPYSTFCQVGIVLGSPSWVSSDEKNGMFFSVGPRRINQISPEVVSQQTEKSAEKPWEYTSGKGCWSFSKNMTGS